MIVRKKVTLAGGGGGGGGWLTQIKTSFMQFLFVTNFEFFNCHCLDENTSNDDVDGKDDNEKQEVHYTNGPCLITDLTQFMQQTWEIKYD